MYLLELIFIFLCGEIKMVSCESFALVVGGWDSSVSIDCWHILLSMPRIALYKITLKNPEFSCHVQG